MVAGRLAVCRQHRLDAAIADAGDPALARHAATSSWLLDGIEGDIARQATGR